MSVASIQPQSAISSVPVFDVVSSALVLEVPTGGKGAKVLVLERYVIPGGSAGYFEREGYRFDVGVDDFWVWHSRHHLLAGP